MKNMETISKPLTWFKLLTEILAKNPMKQVLNESGRIESNIDLLYRMKFKKVLAPSLYEMHVKNDYVSCVFCSYLKRSYCHSSCFRCSKNMYNTCDCLLPGPSSICENVPGHPFSTTWLFKSTCLHFQRLEKNKYTWNLDQDSLKNVITNYETVEGLFYGISNGARPCHICATIDLKLYLECTESENQSCVSKPCNMILEKIPSVCKK